MCLEKNKSCKNFSDLDHWLISRMNSTLLSVDEKLTAYDCTSAAREIELFIDDFSKGQEYGESYQVLYTDTINQLNDMGINLEVFKGDWNEIRQKYIT